MTAPARWHRVKELFDAALVLPPRERVTFLSESCSADAALRAEVESLLAAHADAGSFAQQPAIPLPDASAPLPLADVTCAEAPVLAVGERLGPYEIIGALGAGGMGEVYRARDTRLHRFVALKVLSSELAKDRHFHARFEREGRAIAALAHPHICTLYDIGSDVPTRSATADTSSKAARDHPALDYLVMEYLEGRTLAAALAHGPISIERALRYASQMADALDAAHEKGITHRDLKPANVVLTRDDAVKVLDFGLAKIAPTSTDATAASPGVSQSVVTHGHVVLGTAAYMSPEQARGQPVDKRTDIWAFGCVLYEMLTGRAAFRGPTVSDTIAAILERAPDLTALPAMTPPNVRWLLTRCLEKDQKRRFRDIGDARIELDRVNDDNEPPQRDARESTARWKVAGVAAAGTLAVVALVIALSGRWLGGHNSSPAIMRFPVDLGPDAADPWQGAGAVISPDGTKIVYRARDAAGLVKLFVRALSAESGSPIQGTEGAIMPFFSPDGDAVGFFDGNPGKLKTVSLKDGRITSVADAPFPRGASWGDDGQIVASLESRGPLSRISATSGTPVVISKLEQSVTHRWPQVLPGAQAVIFTANASVGNFDQAAIGFLSLKNGEQKELVRNAYYGRYAASGHLLFVRNDALYAAPFDPRRGEITGPAVTVQNGLRTRLSGGSAILDVSANGTLLYAAGAPVKGKLAWLDATGRFEDLAGHRSQYTFQLRFSPDGQRLAVATAERGNLDVWVSEWQRDAWNRLTTSPDLDSYPVWSPDGAHLAYLSATPQAGIGMLWKRSDGTGEATTLVKPGVFSSPRPASFSPAGDTLAFYDDLGGTRGDLWLLPLEDVHGDHPRPGQPTPFLKTPFNEASPMISPDGQYLAYQSDVSGRDEVYVQAFPTGGQEYAVSTGGGSEPVWSTDRRHLYYRGAEGIMEVAYSTQGSKFSAEKPHLWAKATPDEMRWFDIAPDGKRFIVVQDDVETRGAATPITIVLNFFDELQRRLPSKKRAPSTIGQ